MTLAMLCVLVGEQYEGAMGAYLRLLAAAWLAQLAWDGWRQWRGR